MTDLTSCTIKILTHPDQLSNDWPQGIAGETSLAQSLIFQSKTFLAAWAKSYGARTDCKMLFVEVYDADNKPLIFLPFAMRQQHGINTLTFTDHDVCDYNAPVLFQDFTLWSKTQVQALLNMILAALPPVDVINLQKMPQWVGEQPNPLFLISNQTHAEAGHFSTLDQPWQKLEKSLHRIKNTKQRYRNLLRMGGFEFKIAETDDERHAFIAALIAQKQRRFVETNVPGFHEHPEKQQFFELATDDFGQAQTLHLAALLMNGEIIATLWGLLDGKTYFGMMISHEAEHWSKYSPGMVLHYLVMQNLHEQGFAVLDLGVGDEAWKVNMCDGVRLLHNYKAALTLKGRLTLMAKSLLTGLRSTRIWQAIRPLKWKLLRLVKPSM
ncbi:GNAT family N-acetyltransferase [Paenochrobactrum sp. BZR 588]|uniref:GNAT family N-acetyltransferase n=1 Tax=unclassified Paenochrobactrum TaxID=2639760 RepID=UPI003852B1B5